MTKRCPAPEELLESISAEGENGRYAAISRHIERCAQCRERVRDIRAVSAALHLMGAASPSDHCLTDANVAAFAEGSAFTPNDAPSLHVSECRSCRERVAAFARLIDDASIRAEVDALNPPRVRSIGSPRWAHVSLAGGLIAAAAAALILFEPSRFSLRPDSRDADSVKFRDAAITSTSAPAIVSPTVVNASDSLRWAAVPQADLYRVRIWSIDGTVVWNTDTRHTVMPVPQVLQHGKPYLWEVSARTGWDRWVSSDFVDLSIRGARAP